jgi:hypothetical protein
VALREHREDQRRDGTERAADRQHPVRADPIGEQADCGQGGQVAQMPGALDRAGLRGRHAPVLHHEGQHARVGGDDLQRLPLVLFEPAANTRRLIAS